MHKLSADAKQEQEKNWPSEANSGTSNINKLTIYSLSDWRLKNRLTIEKHKLTIDALKIDDWKTEIDDFCIEWLTIEIEYIE